MAGGGTVTVTSGGELSDVNAAVGASSRSTGDLLLDAGEFINTGALFIGVDGGVGTVAITNHGQLTAGSILVGSGGNLIVDPAIVEAGDFTLSPGGVLSLDIASATNFSELDIFGTGLFQGIVDLDFTGGFAPTMGESFDLINAAGGADFSSATFQIEGLDPGFQYSDTFSDGQLTLVAENDGRSTPELDSAWLTIGGLIILTIVAMGGR